MRAQSFGQKPRGDMEVFVVRLGQLPAPGARFFERWRNLRNAIAGRQRGPAAGEQLVVSSSAFKSLGSHSYFSESRESSLIQGSDSRRHGGLTCIALQGTMAVLISLAALHQLLKDAVQLVEMSVAGDKSSGLKAPAGNQIERLAADVRGVMEGGAQRDVGVVNAVGVERDVRAHGASAKEVHRPALAHHFYRFFPRFGHADGLNGDVDAAIVRGERAGFADGIADAGESAPHGPRPTAAPPPPGHRA